MGAGAFLESGGTVACTGSPLGAYPGELAMLVLRLCDGHQCQHREMAEGTYIEISYDEVFAGLSPVTASLRHASWHSWMFSVAYFLFFASPENAVVLWLPVGNLVDAEPLVRRADETGELTLDVFDVVHAAREGVADIDHDDLPVGLALVEERHDAEDLDLLDLADVADLLADLADIKRVVVTLGLRLRVHLLRVLPRLHSVYAHAGAAGVRRRVAKMQRRSQCQQR